MGGGAVDQDRSPTGRRQARRERPGHRSLGATLGATGTNGL